MTTGEATVWCIDSVTIVPPSADSIRKDQRGPERPGTVKANSPPRSAVATLGVVDQRRGQRCAHGNS
jgi:hypothetical protein